MDNRVPAGDGAEVLERPTECHDRQSSTTDPSVNTIDNTPSTWFELGAELCSEGRVSKDRLERAFEAVRLGVARA